MSDDLLLRHAGAAALTLVESLLIHLQEIGVIDADGRDQIFESAIGGHEDASPEHGRHAAIAELLRRVQGHSDGVAVGDVRPGALRPGDVRPGDA